MAFGKAQDNNTVTMNTDTFAQPRFGMPLLHGGGALLLLGIGLYGLLDYSLLRFPILVLLAVYVTALRYRPNLWLLVLPAALPVFNLAPWSGRFFIEEFDFLLLATLAGCLLSGQYALRQGVWLGRLGAFLLVAFIAVQGVSLVLGLLPLPTLDHNSLYSYYSNYNAPRIAKGFFFALLLYPAFQAQYQADAAKTLNALILGTCVGVLFMGVAVLWERGVINDVLYAADRYQLLRGLLDFSTSYRITGLFSEMHSGGTAIDGYLALTWPLTLWATMRAPRTPTRLLGFAAFLMCTYAVFVTFSRGVALGVLLSAVMIALAYAVLLPSKVPRRVYLYMGLLALLAAALFITAYHQGGSLAISGVAALTLAACLAVCAPGLGRPRPAWALALVPLLLLAWSIYHALVSSKWNPHPAFEAGAWALALSLWALYNGAHLGFYLKRLSDFRMAAIIATAFVFLAWIVTMGVGGYRMLERLSTSGADLEHRTHHWRRAIDIMDRNPLTGVIGMGTGRYPINYLLRASSDEYGTFRFVDSDDADTPLLELGGGKDTRLGQRLWLEPSHAHMLRIRARTSDPQAMLYARICQRQLIHPNEWNPSCFKLEKVLNAEDGWTMLEGHIKANQFLHAKPIGRPPLTLTLSNRREYAFALRPPTLLYIDEVQLIDEVSGLNRIRNPNFSTGGDHWFPYFDFNHLPWHIKNLWVNVYFESGTVGLLLFAALCLLALRRCVALAVAIDHFPLYMGAALLGFFAVGSFGSLIDTPRIAFLFYFFLLVALSFIPRPAAAEP